MSRVVQHHLRDDGLVDLTMTAPCGQRITVTVSATYAKARAWAILADLDPEEAAEAAGANNSRRRTPKGELTQGDRVLLAVAGGCKTVGEIKARTNIKSASIAGRLSDLRDRDLVWQTTGGGGRGIKATYDISTKGEMIVRALKDRAA